MTTQNGNNIVSVADLRSMVNEYPKTYLLDVLPLTILKTSIFLMLKMLAFSLSLFLMIWLWSSQEKTNELWCMARAKGAMMQKWL